MQPHATPVDPAARRHRPKTLTVFAAAFVAGAVLAYGVDRVVDVHVVQVEPQVESEPIFVALRSLPQGSPITIWDVALKDWPKAMLPTTALKSNASFDGMVLRHPIREGQPLLSVQLVRDGSPLPTASVAFAPPREATPAEAAGQAGVAAQAATAQPAAERFVPATPADPPLVGVRTADPVAAPAAIPAATEPLAAPATDAPATETTVEAPGAPAETQDAPADTVVEPTPEATVAATADATVPSGIASAPTATDADTGTGTPTVAGGTSTDIDVPPQTDPAPPATLEPPAAVAVIESVPAPVNEPTEAAPLEPTPAAADVSGSAALPVAARAPLTAPVPALPSTDIGGRLADVGRVQHDDREGATEDPSVLDRTAGSPPPPTEARIPRQHLVIPERIALAADASFTQPRPQPAAPETVVRALPPAVRTPAPLRQPAAAPARSSARRPDEANPDARQPARGARQPAAKTPPAGPRFWSAWFPQVSGTSRQR